MKIAFFETEGWEKEYLLERLGKHELLFFDEEINEKNALKARECEAISVFVYSRIDEKILAMLPKLKLIATRSTGFDHIDIDECRKRRIIVRHVPFYGENTVAEHTFGLILALSRNIHKSYVRTLKDDFSIKDLTGFDLKGKTLGIIGGGNIGMHVARIARGFQMQVLVYDVARKPSLARKLGFNYSELDTLLKNSDIISLHVPHNKFTHHLINKEKLGIVKRGAVLINTARGGIVDTNALLFALDKGIIGGAGLDVIEGEELIKEETQLLYEEGNTDKWRQIVRNHKIFRKENVVFTPHNAFNSREALMRILDTTIENINSPHKEKRNSVPEKAG